MDNDFTKNWIPVKDCKVLFPYWTDETFKAYKNRHKLPLRLEKKGGRWYCSREEFERYKQENNIN